MFLNLSARQKEVIRAINNNDYQYLLDLGALDMPIDMNFPITSDGMTPLMLVCSFGNKIISQVIIKNKGTDLEVVDEYGFNALYYACINNHWKIVVELGKYRINFEASHEGTTCLHVACEKGYQEIVDVFLNYQQKFPSWKKNHPWERQINVNARKKHKSGNGVTPAFLAAK